MTRPTTPLAESVPETDERVGARAQTSQSPRPAPRATDATQACFIADERDHSSDTKQLVKDVLAQLSRDVQSGQSVRKRPPTLGPRRVRSTDRKDNKPSVSSSSRTPSRAQLVTYLDEGFIA